jgi:hypothetical protein
LKGNTQGGPVGSLWDERGERPKEREVLHLPLPKKRTPNTTTPRDGFAMLLSCGFFEACSAEIEARSSSLGHSNSRTLWLEPILF